MEDQDGWWQLKPDARLPSEAELRRYINPDQWCAFESMKAGQHRLFELGVSQQEHWSTIPAEKLQLAIEHLPEVRSQAAHSTKCCIGHAGMLQYGVVQLQRS